MLASEKESALAELAEKNSIPQEVLNGVFDQLIGIKKQAVP